MFSKRGISTLIKSSLDGAGDMLVLRGADFRVGPTVGVSVVEADFLPFLLESEEPPVLSTGDAAGVLASVFLRFCVVWRGLVTRVSKVLIFTELLSIPEGPRFGALSKLSIGASSSVVKDEDENDDKEGSMVSSIVPGSVVDSVASVSGSVTSVVEATVAVSP